MLERFQGKISRISSEKKYLGLNCEYFNYMNKTFGQHKSSEAPLTQLYYFHFIYNVYLSGYYTFHFVSEDSNEFLCYIGNYLLWELVFKFTLIEYTNGR